MRILVVEDEDVIARDLVTGIAAHGYEVERVSDGETAWQQGGVEHYDAIVLDLGLPSLDGMTILKRWRAEGIISPVLVLTARGSWVERVDGIDAGADDYLPKPFRMEELLARLRALLRRSAGQATSVISVGEVRLDTRLMQVSVKGVPLKLTPLEYRLLHYLFHHRGRVISHQELCDSLYAHDSDRDYNAIEALVTRLRRKLGSGVIDTRRGFGYVVAAPE
jgi:two-component system OmpR family response regulator